jgi:hypothetical protein
MIILAITLDPHNAMWRTFYGTEIPDSEKGLVGAKHQTPSDFGASHCEEVSRGAVRDSQD